MSNSYKAERCRRDRYYHIVVHGKLDPSWSEWFSGLDLTESVDMDGIPTTWLLGILPDQGALRGVLNKLWDLNLTLLSLESKDINKEVMK